ncbi:hypothetical protein KW411_11935 [Vibrio fluvialis]|nr:hypothetical protein [Vibrio fluvialis]
MEGVSSDIIKILQYLLPGFITAWIFYGCTSYARPSQFERIVQALIFTIFIQFIVSILHFSSIFLQEHWESIPVFPINSVTFSVTVSILVGFAIVILANNDLLHCVLRKVGVTKESSYPSEWYGAFLDPTFVVLHLKDERRLYGWPSEWPSEPTRGHFVMLDPSWIDNNASSSTYIAVPDDTEGSPTSSDTPIPGVSKIIIDVQDVKWVEFMKKTWE